MKRGEIRAFTLVDFVRESNRIEGIHRVKDAEVVATKVFLDIQRLTIDDLVSLTQVYQPNARPRFEPGLDVRVGQHRPPSGGPQIKAALSNLLDSANARDHDAYELHVLYETLHPFTDGNGRSGRALWLWAMRGNAPLGFLHTFYYQTLQASRLTLPALTR